MNMAANGAHVIVFGNEKGGTGKSTTAMHVAIALAAGGSKVATIDLDARQKTLARYLRTGRTYTTMKDRRANGITTRTYAHIGMRLPLFENKLCTKLHYDK